MYKSGIVIKCWQFFKFKDAMSDFWQIWPKNFDLKFNRYFDWGRESYKLSFESLLEKVRQLIVAVK